MVRQESLQSNKDLIINREEKFDLQLFNICEKYDNMVRKSHKVESKDEEKLSDFKYSKIKTMNAAETKNLKDDSYE